MLFACCLYVFVRINKNERISDDELAEVLSGFDHFSKIFFFSRSFHQLKREKRKYEYWYSNSLAKFCIEDTYATSSILWNIPAVVAPSGGEKSLDTASVWCHH